MAGLKRVFPQRLRARPGVQFLQGLTESLPYGCNGQCCSGVQYCGRDVPGGRVEGDESDQSAEAAPHAE